jgi:uncharacterized membrane protein
MAPFERDAVFAIILTIMVLEFKVPHGAEFEDLLPLWPVFISYVLSFVYVGIYWNNHHHMLHAVHTVNGPMLWANLHLLFWLSLLPFAVLVVLLFLAGKSGDRQQKAAAGKIS